MIIFGYVGSALRSFVYRTSTMSYKLWHGRHFVRLMVGSKVAHVVLQSGLPSRIRVKCKVKRRVRESSFPAHGASQHPMEGHANHDVELSHGTLSCSIPSQNAGRSCGVLSGEEDIHWSRRALWDIPRLAGHTETLSRLCPTRLHFPNLRYAVYTNI